MAEPPCTAPDTKDVTTVVQLLVDHGAKLDARDNGGGRGGGGKRLRRHQWLPIDYADGLVRIGTQSPIPHPDTAKLMHELDGEAGSVCASDGTNAGNGVRFRSLAVNEAARPASADRRPRALRSFASSPDAHAGNDGATRPADRRARRTARGTSAAGPCFGSAALRGLWKRHGHRYRRRG